MNTLYVPTLSANPWAFLQIKSFSPNHWTIKIENKKRLRNIELKDGLITYTANTQNGWHRADEPDQLTTS